MLFNDERLDIAAYRAAYMRSWPNYPPERIGGATADAFGNTPRWQMRSRHWYAVE